jgi:hypothetical protein
MQKIGDNMNNKTRKMINSFYSRLDRSLESKGWGNLVENVLRMELKDEKQHRGSDTARFHCTPTEAAKYFTVKHVFDGFTSHLKVEDILHIRLACFYGEALSKEYGEEIKAAFSDAEIAEFLTLDYVKLIEA